MIYLASPFASQHPEEQKARLAQSAKLVARLTEQGHFVFCPLTYGVGLKAANLALHNWTHADWMLFDLQFLGIAKELYVAMFPGWLESKGVSQEIDMARKLHIPVFYLNPTTLDVFEYAPERIEYPSCENCGKDAYPRKTPFVRTHGSNYRYCDNCVNANISEVKAS